jgi:hypothetical protein
METTIRGLAGFLLGQRTFTKNSKEPVMQNTTNKLCPFCAEEMLPPSINCDHCGLDLHSSILARSEVQPKPILYEIVPDGAKYGIELQGKIKTDGLELEQA